MTLSMRQRKEKFKPKEGNWSKYKNRFRDRALKWRNKSKRKSGQLIQEYFHQAKIK